jgi:hypothetical protein
MGATTTCCPGATLVAVSGGLHGSRPIEQGGLIFLYSKE